METKLPLISYVVKTQFITNNSGLRRIHQQVFTNQDILFAREKAFEYYEAAINVLEREGEIWRDEKTNKIIYKNPENYLKGISIYIRINEDVKKYVWFRDVFDQYGAGWNKQSSYNCKYPYWN